MERLLASVEGDESQLVYLKATPDGRLIVSGISSSGDGSALTDAQLRASALPLPTGAATESTLQSVRDRLPATLGAKPAANSLAVTLAADGAAVGAIGTATDAASASDGTGNYSIIAALKRGLLNWATLLGRVPASVTPGLLPVDTLGTPSTPRVVATGAAASNIVLTAACRRFSMYATQGAWYSISGTATATSHYIAAGERLDLDCPASTTVSVLQESTAGSIRITELV